MNKQKKLYESPDTAVTQVEVESAICGGSVDIVNPANEEIGQIKEQDVNNEFSSNAFSGGQWTEVTN